jgi:hypothetical protein
MERWDWNVVTLYTLTVKYFHPVFSVPQPTIWWLYNHNRFCSPVYPTAVLLPSANWVEQMMATQHHNSDQHNNGQHDCSNVTYKCYYDSSHCLYDVEIQNKHADGHNTLTYLHLCTTCFCSFKSSSSTLLQKFKNASIFCNMQFLFLDRSH